MVTIYAICSYDTNKRYVGCTKNVNKRMREHRCLLNKGKHICKQLNDDWKQYGENRFTLLSLETVKDDKDVKRKAELKWMKKYRWLGILYNERLCSFAPPEGAQAKAAAARVANGYSPSAETRRKQSQAQVGIPKNHGHKISETKRKKKAMI